MAGRIRDADVVTVRERARIEDVVGEYVTLRNAGGGNLKALCPFHEEKTPSFSVAPAKGVWYCLAGETRVLTWAGVRPIRELAGGVHRVLGRDANWVEAPFFSFGVQPLMRIVLTRNGRTKEIFATPEHRWFVKAGRELDKLREETTEALRPGHRLASVYPRSRIRLTTPSSFGIAHGITFGDGSRNGTGSMAELDPVKDAQLLKWFPHERVTDRGSQLRVHNLPRFFKDLPSLEESTSYLYGWLAGYFAADGCVDEDGMALLTCAKREVLEFVRMVCTRLGIGTYGIGEQRREGFPGRAKSAVFTLRLVTDDLTERFFLLDQHRIRFDSSRRSDTRRGWIVREVTPTERVEEVFCAVVPEGHAFVLEDNILTGNCFGCAEGGDVIRFVEKVEQMTFVEAVERLAERAGVQLTYEQAGPAPVRQQGVKQRLVAAHQEAARFYADQLASPDAKVGREFLAERGFDKAAAEQFGVGFAPTSWDSLVKHLRAKGYGNQELLDAGLAKTARSGSLIDRFHGRLLWPIRDLGGDVVGFGARRLLDGDDGPKYLNTPETAIYRKSHLLYGLDLAKREIARRHQAVVVEGYTDVMACHLAGVPTAVATCGTAFGADHIQVLRRLIFDRTEDDAAEIIFTFDGDAAGQKAALRAFEDDQRFLMQTFVAVERSGADPCELRQARGDTAVRDLVARREPLVAFALRTIIGRYDVTIPEGRVQALRRAAPLVARIKDRQLRSQYATRLAIECGVDERTAREAVHRAIQGEQAAAPAKRAVPDRPDPADPDPAVFAQREALKLALQHPVLAGPLFDAIDTAPYTHPAYAAVRQGLAAMGGVASQAGGVEYLDAARAHCPDLVSQALVAELAVEPLRLDREPDADYVRLVLARLQVPVVGAEVAALKAKLQRMNPVEEPDAYTKLVGELFALEQHLRGLRDQALGS